MSVPDSPASVQRRLRALPSVERLADALCHSVDGSSLTRAEAVAGARAALTARRAELLAGAQDEVDLLVRARICLTSSLRRVLNGTGVIVHTNLGRAPLAEAAVDELVLTARGYVNLELDLGTGRRGSRDLHLTRLLCELTDAEDALVVNNGAAAVLLAAAALGKRGSKIVVSRGQLVEIGGGFRIPEVVAQAGSQLVEVGTTNRTHLDDYRAAIAAGAGLILRVHPSNFRSLGYVSEVDIEALCGLGVPVIDDIGSGVLPSDLPIVADEPSAERSIRAGAAVVCFSGDKLLGGPQAGILIGTRAAIDLCRRHPLVRALRIGRLPLAALAATLALYRDRDRALREVPVLSMLTVDRATLQRRAGRLAKMTGGEIVDASAKVGGGALPILELQGPAVVVGEVDAARMAARLRASDPPLLARIERGRVLIDPRTLSDSDLDIAAAVVRRAVEELAGSGARRAANDARGHWRQQEA